MISHSRYNIREIKDVTAFKNGLNQNLPGSQVWIQTCKRLEVYSGYGEINYSTALHLFRLVSGLDSVFLGDSAIKGQVKKSYQEAAAHNELSKGMHRLFQWALYVGKLVRSTTDISVGAISYPQAVIQALKSVNPELMPLTVTLVGVNAITGKLIKWLTASGVLKLNMVNRTFDKVEKLAETHNASAFPLNDLSGLIKSSDVIILCTSAPDYLLNQSDIPKGKNCCIIDLSWPRNSNPDITELPGIQVYTLDHLEQNMNQNLERRKESVTTAEQIIEHEVMRLIAWQQQEVIYQPGLILKNQEL
jgi:glutamyl-tRNA reductase